MFSQIKLRLLFVFAVTSLLSLSSQAELINKQVLGLSGAKKIAAAAELEAVRNKWNVVIAVVDDGGHLVYLQRLDGAPTGSIDVAIGKARTAAAFKRPTQVFDEMTKTRPAITSIPGIVPLEGGVPVMVDGQLVGAVGVSGATSQQDVQVAEAGISALGA
tara:strand:+ start:3295 stop:3774 length:480 start_codon:yes stop_codon:yes gene_type:complete